MTYQLPVKDRKLATYSLPSRRSESFFTRSISSTNQRTRGNRTRAQRVGVCLARSNSKSKSGETPLTQMTPASQAKQLLAPNVGDASPASKPVQLAFEAKKKQKCEGTKLND